MKNTIILALVISIIMLGGAVLLAGCGTSKQAMDGTEISSALTVEKVVPDKKRTPVPTYDYRGPFTDETSGRSYVWLYISVKDKTTTLKYSYPYPTAPWQTATNPSPPLYIKYTFKVYENTMIGVYAIKSPLAASKICTATWPTLPPVWTVLP